MLKLNRAVLNCDFRYTDITAHIKQNCDATSRVLTKHTIKHLTESIPGSSATQLYLIAAVYLLMNRTGIKSLVLLLKMPEAYGKVYLYGVNGESVYV